jgi:hypothetical protein
VNAAVNELAFGGTLKQAVSAAVHEMASKALCDALRRFLESVKQFAQRVAHGDAEVDRIVAEQAKLAHRTLPARRAAAYAQLEPHALEALVRSTAISAFELKLRTGGVAPVPGLGALGPPPRADILTSDLVKEEIAEDTGTRR